MSEPKIDQPGSQNRELDTINKVEKQENYDDIGLTDTNDEDDEEEDKDARPTWTNECDFLLSSLGFAVGLGNVWRFPYLAYKNGGGSFFIPYFLMLFIVGCPVFFLEMVLGQFTSKGPTSCWEFALFFQGLGFAMVTITTTIGIYYNMILAWAIYYLFVSFSSELPWQTCQKPWASELCWDGVNITANISLIANIELPTETVQDSGMGLIGRSRADTASSRFRLPAEDYFNRHVTGFEKGVVGLDNLGSIMPYMVVCLIAAWLIVVAVLFNGVKSAGKVVYVTATAPYMLLTILLIQATTLEGTWEGVEYYITPTMEPLKDANTWKLAATQIFFSLGNTFGSLMALSSYNKFKHNLLKDAIVVSLANCVTSVFCGFVIFSYIGFLAHENNRDVEDVTDSGIALAFVVYPEALKKLPGAQAWNFIFFLMILSLGLDTQFVIVETVTTSILDVFPQLRKVKFRVLIITCLAFFLVGLPMTFEGGREVLNFLDTYAMNWNAMIIAFGECMAISWVYGVNRFLRDVELMVGTQGLCCIPWWVWAWYWRAMWSVLTPATMVTILTLSVMAYYSPEREPSFPEWAESLGVVITMLVVVVFFFVLVYNVIKLPPGTPNKFLALTTPTASWGPAKMKHRIEVAKYVSRYVIDTKPFDPLAFATPGSPHSDSKVGWANEEGGGSSYDMDEVVGLEGRTNDPSFVLTPKASSKLRTNDPSPKASSKLPTPNPSM